jgi:hypothetical protein
MKRIGEINIINNVFYISFTVAFSLELGYNYVNFNGICCNFNNRTLSFIIIKCVDIQITY